MKSLSHHFLFDRPTDPPRKQQFSLETNFRSARNDAIRSTQRTPHWRARAPL